MKSLLCIVTLLAIHIHSSVATDALGLSAIGESGAFRLVKAITATPTASIGSPISVLPFQTSAGVNKLLVVDSENLYYIVDDINNQDLSDLAVTQAGTYIAGQVVALGNDIYIADAAIPQILGLHADGGPEGVAVTLGSTSTILGLAANHQTGKLYAAASDGLYEVDPLTGGAPVQLSGVADTFKWAGIAFSADYQTLYASTLSLEGHPELDSVYGFVLNDGQAVEVSHSPDMGGAYGLLAGTGCLSEYLFVMTNAGLAQIDFHGVDQLVAVHSDPQAVANAFLSYDPVDGSMLIPEKDGVYKFFAPSCGGFASVPKLRAHALPVGHACSLNVDCSSNRCTTGVCQANGYLGACQQDSDCVDTFTVDGLFCQSATIHTTKEHHSKKHKYNDVDLDARRNTAPYGACEINSCVSAWGGCDADATCTPTGDAQRTCNCNAGYFGNGLEGHCVSPCDVTPPPCDVLAACTPLSATTFRCDCPTPAYFGVGTVASPCMPSPCALDSNGKNACGAGICTPTSTTDYDCQCLPGNFREIPPLDGSDYTVAYPQCVADRCSVNNGDCALNALCTPTGMGMRTCACAPGFLPQGTDPTNPTSCKAASCISLTPGVFPLDDPHATTDTCVGKVNGDHCKLGCVTGYKATVAGRSYSSITAVCTPHNGVNIYTFTPFTCIADVGGRRGDRDGDQGSINFRSPWYCGVSVTGVPCSPTAPWVVTKDAANRRLILKWTALGTSPEGDIVSSLTVHITPDGNSNAGFSTPNIPSPMFATTVTIDNLLVGHTYVFRLIAVTQNGVATGLPLEITF